MPFSRTFEQLLHINCAALVSSTLTFKTRTNHPQGFLCHYQAEVQSQVNVKSGDALKTWYLVNLFCRTQQCVLHGPL